MKKVLVTGATGFIGNYVIRNLLQLDNLEIIATSRSIEKASSFEWFSKIKYIPTDLSEKKDNWFEFFQKPNLMIHLAWEDLPNYKELFHIEKNLWNNYTFLSNMIKNGLSDLTIAGTCFEYGLQNGCLSEEMEAKPCIPYALAKDCLRKFLEELQKKNHFSLKWNRLFYMYGDGQSKSSILSQLELAVKNGDRVFNMSGGEQLRDYLHIEKISDNLVKIALQNKVTGIINNCSGKPISIRRLVEQYIQEKGYLIKLNLGYYPYPDYEPMSFWGDNLKLLKKDGSLEF
ncbi:MAG: NAD-dependent epimerase/dehydratase family protein [Flavobacteriales bacterium]|nr:NAD-dependent epimerase/dehydratase family protein [Leptospiraceae bacterium]MCB9336311.1 NAD-dependent epimerase/dehydratase family protein [Flavobacteriales bacterium]